MLNYQNFLGKSESPAGRPGTASKKVNNCVSASCAGCDHCYLIMKHLQDEVAPSTNRSKKEVRKILEEDLEMWSNFRRFSNALPPAADSTEPMSSYAQLKQLELAYSKFCPIKVGQWFQKSESPSA